MLDELLAQLQSSDAEVRRNAIIALGRTKNPKAVQALARVYREDPNPSLRELAKKAAAFIRQQTGMDVKTDGGTSSPSDGGADSRADSGIVKLRTYATPSAEDINARLNYSPSEEAPAPKPAEEDGVKLRVYEMSEAGKAQNEKASSNVPQRGKKYTVSAANQQSAKHAIESALSANMRGDNARALKDLAAALRLDPNLISDGYFGSIAASVTDAEGDEAIRLIVDGGKRKEFVDAEVSKAKRQRKDTHLEKARESTWSGIGFELVIFFIINVVFTIFSTLLMIEGVKNLVSTMGGMSEIDRATRANLELLLSVDIFPLVLAAVISAVGVVVSTLIQTVFVHIVARFLRGTGTYKHLLLTMLMVYNKWIPRLYFVIGIAAFVVIISMSALFGAVAGLAILVVLFKFSSALYGRVGEAYNFSSMMGCMSVLGATLLIFLINVLLMFAFGQVWLNLLAQMSANSL